MNSDYGRYESLELADAGLLRRESHRLGTLRSVFVSQLLCGFKTFQNHPLTRRSSTQLANSGTERRGDPRLATQMADADTKRLLALLQHTPSPALVVSMSAVRHNVARMIELCGGDASRWRPHLKTTKLPPVWRVLLDAGVTRFKVATPRELEHLGRLAAEAARARAGDTRLEDIVTISLMSKFGWERVRGGRWCQLALEGPPDAVMRAMAPQKP